MSVNDAFAFLKSETNGGYSTFWEAVRQEEAHPVNAGLRVCIDISTDAQAQCTKFMALGATSGCLWPIGFGFRPTEEELITHYLINKILGRESLVKYIHEIDVYNYDPWQLPAKSFFESNNYEWFFFRAHTSKTKRSTPAGCWKTTGDDRPIKARGTNKIIATRKILVFYRGRGANAVKTNWVIHEYHLHPDAYSNSSPYHSQPPFVVCRLKENAEERYVSICDQDEHNRTVASHLKKKGKRNRDAQAPALEDFQSLNMQPIQPGASVNEDNLTEVLNSILLRDEYTDDATSKMCRPPWSSIGNDGEVNNQSLQAQAFESEHNLREHNLREHFLNSILSDDENCGEVTSNNRIDSYSKEELDHMIYELQHGGFTTDTDTPFVLLNNHISSAVQNMSTIKKSHRSPLAMKRFQYKEEQCVLQGVSSVLSSKGEGAGEARACGIFMDSDNSDSNNGPKSEAGNKATKRGMSCCRCIASTNNHFSYIVTTKCIPHNSSLPLVYAAKACLGILMFVMFAQEVLLYGHRR